MAVRRPLLNTMDMFSLWRQQQVSTPWRAFIQLNNVDTLDFLTNFHGECLLLWFNFISEQRNKQKQVNLSKENLFIPKIWALKLVSFLGGNRKEGIVHTLTVNGVEIQPLVDAKWTV